MLGPSARCVRPARRPHRAPTLWALLLWMATGTALCAQHIPQPGPDPWARWESEDWLTVGAVAGVAAGSFLLEERVRGAFQENRSGLADFVERVGWWYGTPLFTAPASLLTMGAGVLFDEDEVKDTGLLMSGVLLTALLGQQPLRIAVGRARPYTGEGHLSFDSFNPSNDHASFVSGHAWSAFGISNVVARQIDQTWASVGLYSLATITALSRMYADAHWLTDVVLGSIGGYALSEILWDWHEEAEAPAELQAASRRWVVISLRL